MDGGMQETPALCSGLASLPYLLQWKYKPEANLQADKRLRTVKEDEEPIVRSLSMTSSKMPALFLRSPIAASQMTNSCNGMN